MRIPILLPTTTLSLTEITHTLNALDSLNNDQWVNYFITTAEEFKKYYDKIAEPLHNAPDELTPQQYYMEIMLLELFEIKTSAWLVSATKTDLALTILMRRCFSYMKTGLMQYYGLNIHNWGKMSESTFSVIPPPMKYTMSHFSPMPIAVNESNNRLTIVNRYIMQKIEFGNEFSSRYPQRILSSNNKLFCCYDLAALIRMDRINAAVRVTCDIMREKIRLDREKAHEIALREFREREKNRRYKQSFSTVQPFANLPYEVKMLHQKLARYMKGLQDCFSYAKELQNLIMVKPYLVKYVKKLTNIPPLQPW
jgi:hypothetical protein